MQINDIVEDFTLENQDGKTVHLSDYKKSPVVLFFIRGRIRRAAPSSHAASAMRLKSSRRRALWCWDFARHGEGPEEVQGQVWAAVRSAGRPGYGADPALRPAEGQDDVRQAGDRSGTHDLPDRRGYGKGQRLLHVFEQVTPQGHAEEVFALLKAGGKK